MLLTYSLKNAGSFLITWPECPLLFTPAKLATRGPEMQAAELPEEFDVIVVFICNIMVF